MYILIYLTYVKKYLVLHKIIHEDTYTSDIVSQNNTIIITSLARLFISISNSTKTTLV